MYSLVSNGAVLLMTQAERDKIRGSAKKTLSDGLWKVQSRIEEARDHTALNTRSMRTSGLSSGAVHLFGGIHDPGERHRSRHASSRGERGGSKGLHRRGQLARGAMFLARAKTFAKTAKRTSQGYVDNLISTAETT